MKARFENLLLLLCRLAIQKTEPWHDREYLYISSEVHRTSACIPCFYSSVSFADDVLLLVSNVGD